MRTSSSIVTTPTANGLHRGIYSRQGRKAWEHWLTAGMAENLSSLDRAQGDALMGSTMGSEGRLLGFTPQVPCPTGSRTVVIL